MFKFKNTINKNNEEFINSSNKIKTGLSALFNGKKLDENILEEFENLMITADININIVNDIVEFLRKHKFDKNITAEEVKEIIFKKIKSVFNGVVNKNIELNTKPYVMMFLGVNGSGKTTIIGKLAYQLKQEGKKVLLAGCDTFRVGATEQLSIWKDRAGVDIVSAEKEGEDPASVAYKAIVKAKQENYDVLLIDTAGRLQNNTNLMNELSKIEKVIKKVDETAPHNSVIVLDGTSGQNTVKQVELFQKYVNIDNIIINKMDGTSKGGILVSIVDRFKKPILAVGVGERIEDIENFDVDEFVSGLLG